ncbi:unnamed protein product [Closterium sp. NIES-54]
MDVWGPARVRGQGHERYFLLVVDDYSRYTIVFPLRSKGDVTEVLIDWIRAARLQLRRSFGSDFPVLRLHSDRGREFSSGLLRAYCCARGIRQTFTLPESPQKNGIAERRIGMVMDVTRTSMMHAAAPHFLWPFAVRYAAHQINLQPRVSMPETSPALLWTGKVGDASAFRVWGSRAFVRDLSADKVSPRAAPCVFLGFPSDAPGWQFYHPTSRRVLSSQDVTFDESVPYYRPAPSGVSQVDAIEPVEVAGDSGAAEGATPGGAGPEGTTTGGAEPGGAESGGAEPRGAMPGGAEPGGATPGGAEPGGADPEGAGSAGAVPGGSPGASSRRKPLSPQEMREWFARRWRRAAGARGAAGSGGSVAAEGAGATGSGGARTRSTGAAGPAGTPGAGAAAGVGVEAPAVGPGGGPAEGTTGATGGSGAGAATGAGASTGGAGAVPAVSGVAARPRPYFVPLLQQVLGLPSSTGPPPSIECPQPVPSQLQLQPASPLPAPSPYTGPTGGLAERREPAFRPALPFRASRTSDRGSRQRPPPVPGTHRMSLRPSTAPLRAPLPSPPESSLPSPTDPESDSLRAARPSVTRLLATVVIDPSFESTAVSALVAELIDFAARCRLDYAAGLVAESESVCPPSVEGECALGTDVLEDRQEEFQCLAAASPHLVSVLLTPEGDPDALDIPTPRSYAEAIEGPYSSQWQAAMDAEMASWKSTGTYVDEVPPPGANIVSGMWIFRVKRPPSSPPVFKARYVARGFSQRQGVDYFQTFSPTPKMTTLRVLLHIDAQRDYELHSLDFSTAFLQGSLHEEIWLRRPLGFTGTFPPGTQWSLRRPVYGLRQAPREWHDTLRTTLAALGFAPSTADPTLFLRTDTSLPPFYILVYVDDLVFATADTAGLAHVKSELQKRHTCTDLGELRSYLGLQITRDRAQRTITLTQSHMVQQVLKRFGFTYSSPQATPLRTRHSLSALPSDESVESSGPYPELVGCLMYLMTCTRPDLAYPLCILACYVAPGRHRPEHMAAAKRVLRYLCSTSGMGLVLGGRSPVVLTGHADASWADAQATQRSSQGYTFSLGSGSVSWRATRSSSVLGSSCEAEIYAGAMAAQELRWLTYLLTVFGEVPRSPPVLYVDNKAMLALCREQRLEHRTKHIALRYFLARELQQRGQLRLAYVASEANTADIFTKALAPCDHQRFFTVVTDPSFESIAASALVTEPLDFAAICPLDYATALVVESKSANPPSGGAAVPHLVAMLLAPKGDSDAPDIPSPRSYAEAITVPYCSQWQTAMDTEMASLKSTGTYVSQSSVCLRTTLAALGFAPSTADPSLLLRTDTSLPLLYVLVYVDDLVFATADTEALALVKSELQKRHTCTDLGELRNYLGLQITRYRARHTITLTHSHMVHQVLQRFGFRYSSPQSTPLPTGHSLSAPPSDESVEPSGPYPELVGCLMVLRYLCSTSGMGLVLGGRGPVVLTGHADASWSQQPLQPLSPLPAPSPYTEQTGGLTEHRELVSRPSLPVRAVRTSRRVPRPRPPLVPGTHVMALRPSSVPLRSIAASALVTELLDLAAICPLDYATALVVESESANPLSVGGECALGTDVLEDKKEDFECLAAAVPHLVAMLLAPEGDPDAPDIPSPRSYAEAIMVPYSSQWQTAMDTEMASLKSTGTYVCQSSVCLRTTLAALGTADPSLLLRTDTSLPPLYVLVARRTITLTQSHMVHQVLQRFGFRYSSPQSTPLHTGHSLLAPPSDESVEPSGPYPELVGCLMVLRYLCSTSDMGLVLGGRGPIVLTSHADASWVDDLATQRSSQGYTFSLVLYVDNNAMIALYQEHRLEHRTKHIALRYFVARELQQLSQLRLTYVATRANTADIFTKALQSGDHQRFCTVLGLVPTLPHLLTA